MRILFKVTQELGFVIAAVGVLAVESSIWTSIGLMASGGLVMYVFVKLENGFYFDNGG